MTALLKGVIYTIVGITIFIKTTNKLTTHLDFAETISKDKVYL